MNTSLRGLVTWLVVGFSADAFAQTCPANPPAVDHGTYAPCAGAPAGTSCVLTCGPGYSRLGSNPTCTGPGWSGAPTCEPNACPVLPPGVPNGTFSCTLPVASGQVCSATCDRGFVKSGTDPTCVLGVYAGSTVSCDPTYCSPLSLPTGSLSNCGTAPQNSTCTLSCAAGYHSATGQSTYTSTCDLTAWTIPPEYACIANPCLVGPQPAPVNGSYPSCAGTASGVTCPATCDPGYTKSGSDPLCFLGAWSGGSVTCNPNACTTPPSPVLNGSYGACTGAPSGSACALTCDVGFTMSGSNQTCTLGAWSGAAPTCEPAFCPAGPSAVAHGSYSSCAGAAVGTSCSLTCDAGYSRNGSNPTCVVPGWSGSPTCEANSCSGPPTPVANGSYGACTATPSGSSCALACNAGYTKVGTDQTCTLGAWTGAAPACAPNACTGAPPSVANGSYGNCSVTASGDSCALTCDVGFTMSGSNQTCTLGAWSGAAPTCEPAFCPAGPSAVAHGSYSCAGAAVGTSCSLTCDAGYSRNGSNPTCVVPGWSGSPTCEANSCSGPPAPVANGSYGACTATPSGSSCALACNAGYTKVGTDQTCTLGAWTGAAPTCAANACTGAPPSVANGSYAACASTPSGATCSLTCNPGYSKAGVDQTCTLGAWTGAAPTCAANACTGAPPSVANGSYAACASTASGDTCALTCNSGYSKSGADQTCALGVWAGAAPTCVANSCSGVPPAVSNGGYAPCSMTSSGATCALTCNAGYTKTGADPTCALGVWSGSPECSPNPCAAAPTSVANGAYASSCTAVASGDTCTLTCNPGYTKSGADQICRAGEWTGAAPTCAATACAEAPPPVSNGTYASCPGAALGTTCSLTCNPGFAKTGTDPTCTLGVWVGAPRCVFHCTMSSECPTSNPVCDSSTGACVECLLDSSCPSHHCDATRHQCTTSCADDLACDGGRCDLTGASCVECLVNGDCASGDCETQTHTCAPVVCAAGECTDAGVDPGQTGACGCTAADPLGAVLLGALFLLARRRRLTRHFN